MPRNQKSLSAWDMRAKIMTREPSAAWFWYRWPVGDSELVVDWLSQWKSVRVIA